MTFFYILKTAILITKFFSYFQLQKDAIISQDGNYRYQLSRIWDEQKPKVLFIMLM